MNLSNKFQIIKNNTLFHRLFPVFILTIIALIFFYPIILEGKIPFPGDLLLSEYNPWRQSSFFGFNPASIPNKGQYFDVIREFYPWMSFTLDELFKWKIPLWNPYNFSGAPHLANFQTAVLYPLNIIYIILGQVRGYSVMIFLQPLLTSLFMYLYARKIGISRFGSIFSGLITGYSTYMTVWLEFGVVGHTLMWFPLMLFAVENLKTKHNIGNLSLFVFSTLLSLLSGYPMDFIYYLGFISIYWIFLTLTDHKNIHRLSIFRYFYIFIVTAIPILMGSIQLLPAIANLLTSTRVDIPYEFLINNMIIQPYQMVMMIIPDYFGNPATKNYWLSTSYVSLTLSIGIAPIILIPLTIINAITKKTADNLRYRFFIICILILFALIIRTPFTELIYKFHIPLFSSSSPTRLMTLIIIFSAVLDGRGVDLFLKGGRNLKTVILIVILFSFALISIKFLPPDRQMTALRNSIMSSGFMILAITGYLIGVIWKKFRKQAVVFFTLILLTERFLAFHKFNPFVPESYIFPKSEITEKIRDISGINRFYGYGTAKIESNLSTYYKIFSADGFDAINNFRYNSFLRSSKDGKIENNFTHENRSVAEIIPGYGADDLPQNNYRLRIMDALGVKYIIDRVENPKNNNTFSANRFKKIWENDNGWFIYENLYSAPRYFLTGDVRYYENNSGFEKIFFDPEFNPATMILLPNDVKPSVTAVPAGKRDIQLISYEPNRIVFQTDSDQAQLLYISDTYDAGWKAYVDNKSVEIYIANFAFRAIPVSEGSHQIYMLYQPDYFRSGLIITIFTFIVYCGYGLILKNYNKSI